MLGCVEDGSPWQSAPPWRRRQVDSTARRGRDSRSMPEWSCEPLKLVACGLSKTSPMYCSAKLSTMWCGWIALIVSMMA